VDSMKRVILLTIEGCVHRSSEHLLCERCFNDIAENVDLSEIEEPPWRNLPAYDSRYPTHPERVYYVGVYIRIEHDGDIGFCSACGKWRGMQQYSPAGNRRRIGNEISRKLRYYRIYRKLMEFIPKHEIDSIMDSVYNYNSLAPLHMAKWSRWSKAHPLD